MDIIQRKTLDWVNRTRFHEFSLPPLDKLPKGVRGCSSTCVISMCFSTRIGDEILSDGTILYVNPTTEAVVNGNGIEMPQYVREFVNNFDDGLYPELDIEATRRTAGYLNRTHDSIQREVTPL